MMSTWIHGNCPMGPGHVLAVVKLVDLCGRHSTEIRCETPECPRPTAVHEILADAEWEHVIEVRQHDFTLRHPLRERLDDDLFSCHLNYDIRELDTAPVPVGRYSVSYGEDGELHFESLDPPGSESLCECPKDMCFDHLSDCRLYVGL